MHAARRGVVFEIESLDQRRGQRVFRVRGTGARALFADEAGGHRWQRVPPNEKRGRVHTSTVTVAVLAEPEEAELQIAERDLKWSTCCGTGAGGQKRNKTETTVKLTHLPTGLQVRCEDCRSQLRNRRVALALLRARLLALEEAERDKARAADRKQQVGSGMRGDKRRTIRVQDGQVIDHATGRCASPTTPARQRSC